MYIGAYMFLFGFIDKKVLKMGVQAGAKDRSAAHYSTVHFVKKCLSQCLSEVFIFK